MNKVQLTCVKCKIKLDYISSSRSSSNTIKKEIWECPICNFEVMIHYVDTKQGGAWE